VKTMQFGIHSHTFVSESQKLVDGYYNNYAAQMSRIGKERGWPPFSRAQYEGGRSKEGALFIGSPAEVVDKILFMHELFGITRFIAHMDVGAPAHAEMMKSIELFGTKVAPEVKKAVANIKQT